MQRTKSIVEASSTTEALFRANELDTAEIGGLVQELTYHTDTSNKQLQELCQRLQVSDGTTAQAVQRRLPTDPLPCTTPVGFAPAKEEPTESEKLAAVLAEFNLPRDPSELRETLLRRHRAASRTEDDASQYPPMLPTPSSSSAATGQYDDDDEACKSQTEPRPAHTRKEFRHMSGFRSRMQVRLKISQFLQVPKNRIRLTTLWRHEVSNLQLVQHTTTLRQKAGEKWYERLTKAFEAQLSNLLDENDSPLREVAFDLLSREARFDRSAAAETGARPVQVDGVKLVLRSFGDAVVAVRGGAEHILQPLDRSERSQWVDCLSRVSAQFERVVDETWKHLWKPGSGDARSAKGSHAVEESPTDSPHIQMCSLQKALKQNYNTAKLVTQATKAIAVAAGAMEGAPGPAEQPVKQELHTAPFWRQAITVSKLFLQLGREMTLLTGLWTSEHEQETEHLSATVLRQEYRRVRRTMADLLMKRSREIIDAWSARVHKEVLQFATSLGQHDRPVMKKILAAVIEWWRSGNSGRLRLACMDVVALHISQEAEAGSHAIEQVQGSLPCLEEIVMLTLRRELAVRPGMELSAVDEPRIQDILARLTSELNKHLDSEWHILQGANLSASSHLWPNPELFQPPNWTHGQRFDYGVVKTAFLGAWISGRYVVTNYVSRGAIGRVWVVEDRINPAEFPLCLKTFYCECECEEMSNLSKKEFKRCILEELSQVERWMTSGTRLAGSRHLVRVEKVLRDAPVVRGGQDGVSGTISGILMEFCDKGELTSYLWDSKKHIPRSFDMLTGQFLFAQLMETLVELFAPPLIDCHQGHSFTFEEMDSGSLTVPLRSFAGVDEMLNFHPLERAATAPPLGYPTTSPVPTPGTAQQAAAAARMPLHGRVDSVSSDLGGLLAQVPPPTSPDIYFLQAAKPRPVKYFHNDIKTENLVISGTTLKLIDFQSLTPLRNSRDGSANIQVQHATLVYQHRYPPAAGETIEAKAESTAIWACGVILTRMLAAELPSDWVFHHRGLGTQEDLERRLPEGHRLLDEFDLDGPRNLLEKIFSPEATPSIMDVLTHSWCNRGREQSMTRSTAEVVQRRLQEMLPAGSDPSGILSVWMPLTMCIRLEGEEAPVQVAEEVIKVAMNMSDGHFRQEGRRIRHGERARSKLPTDETEATFSADPDGSPEDGEAFYEWQVALCDNDEDNFHEDVTTPAGKLPETSAGVEDLMSLRNKEFDDTPLSPGGEGLVTASPADRVRRNSSTKGMAMWRRTLRTLVVDRFYVQLRVKEHLGDDDPSGVWWLRIKWLRPMLTAQKSRPGAGAATAAGVGQSSSFVRIQQSLLEGQREVAQRAEERRLEERKVQERPAKKKTTLHLPI
eukprot:TRINITY_DN18114_c0_g1_i3.p1 TRINITY_DN18114_c0_g1~~TRINITY_DN18114_c0_g1_i3.p1  ORF type:complete len:1361 (-),score=255.77 TRINITY_DN18114_c0_g1_i3:205-4287(-)